MALCSIILSASIIFLVLNLLYYAFRTALNITHFILSNTPLFIFTRSLTPSIEHSEIVIVLFIVLFPPFLPHLTANTLHTQEYQLHQPNVIQPPANIIMAPQIIQEYILFGKSIDNIHLHPQQPDISGCYCIPRSSRCSNIIKHMALQFFSCSQIRDYFIWSHDHFSKQQYFWTNNFTNTYNAHVW